MVVRTAVIDAMLREAVSGGARTIVNLGAGLDARPYRLSWPASLRWLDVDFAEVLDWKCDRLRNAQATCRVDQVKMDLTDGEARRRLFAQLAATSPATLVLTEGVIPYLTEAEVGALADDLHGLPGISWIVDYFAPQNIPFHKRLRVSREMRAAPFQFEPLDWFAFFGEHGWRPADIKYLAIEGERLGRPAPLSTLLKAAVRSASCCARPPRQMLSKSSRATCSCSRSLARKRGVTRRRTAAPGLPATTACSRRSSACGRGAARRSP